MASISSKISNIEQSVDGLAARVAALEAGAASVSSGSGSARSWPSLEQVDGSTAAGSHGPGSSAHKKPVTIHCKAGSVPARLAFETTAKSQDFVVRYKDVGIPYEIDSSFCNVKQLLLSANPNHLKTGRSESNLRLCGECWQNSSKFSSLKEMMKVDDEGAFIVPAHDARSQVLSIKDRRNGVGKPVFKTCTFWKWTVVYPC